MDNNKIASALLLFALGCLALYGIAVFTDFDIKIFIQTVRAIPVHIFMFWLVLGIVEYAFQVKRFEDIIGNSNHSFIDFSIFYNIGHLIAFLSPSRSIGEAARIFVFKKYLNISKTKAFSSIVTERAMDILILALASVGVVSLISSSLIPLALIAVAVGFIIFLTNHHIHSFVLGIIPVTSVKQLAEKYFLHSRALFGNKKKFSWLFLLSILIWMFDFYRYWLILSYFNVNIPFELSAGITSLSYFSTIISIFPGGLAFFEGAGTGLLSVLGYSSSQVLSALLVERIFSYWIWIFTGVTVFFAKGIKIQ